MAYSSTQYQLTHLLQDVYDRLEQTRGLDATGGTTTTIVDSRIPSDIKDNSFNRNIAFVRYDAGGAGAAPEGEYQIVSAYDQSTTTVTVDTAFSAAIAAGDLVTLARASLYPLNDVIRMCNSALRSLGDIDLPDTSLTSAADQTEYDLPVALKAHDLIDVMYNLYTGDSNDNRWQSLRWKIHPAAPGSTGLLIIEQIPSSRTIKIIYRGRHPLLSAYSDPVAEMIHPELAVSTCAYKIARWKRNASEDKMAVLKQEYEEALQRHPINFMSKRGRGMPQWDYSRPYPGQQQRN